jgi:acetyl-CoA acetyltransferase
MSAAYVLDAARTPFGRHGGALAGVRPDGPTAHAVCSRVAVGRHAVAAISIGVGQGLEAA